MTIPVASPNVRKLLNIVFYTSSPHRKILVAAYCWHTGRSGLSVTIPAASPNVREVIDTEIVVFVFNVPPTVKVMWRQCHGLKSHPTDW